MKVKMLTSMAGPNLSYQAGQVVEMDEKEAERLISAGFAEKAGGREAPETATKSAPEKATRPAQGRKPAGKKNTRSK
ncbi:MAG: hypothetical protein SWK76_17025 [Actinomycetota bacterium]|nr:hypothetical protein [Actinomycetota bacterium]